MVAPSINENSPISSFEHEGDVSNDIKALTFLSKWGEFGPGTGATVYFSFPSPSGQSDLGDGYSKEPIDDPNAVLMRVDYPSEVQINSARSALQKWANVANLNFVEVPVESPASVGDIRISNFTIIDPPPDSRVSYAFAIPPIASDNTGISGDVWFNRELAYDSTSEYALGARGYQVMLHELGHALGLDHPFLDEHDHEGAEAKVVLDASKDHYQYTIMSYSDVAWDNYYTSPTFYPTSPMLLDVQAIQYLYGANTSYNTGDNIYAFGADYAYEAIWDAGGNDTIKNVGELDSVINLNAGAFSSIGPSVKSHRSVSAQTQNNIAIAYDVSIENAIGGQGNDIIYGNSLSNMIDGGPGTDTFITALNRGDITSILALNHGQILLSSATQQDVISNVEKVNFADSEYYLDSLLQEASSAPDFRYEQGESKAVLQANIYEGTVSYLQFEYLGGEQGEVVIGADTNDFLNLLGGDDAALGGGGNDVLDGGVGSNFLGGGYGADVFFVDGRSKQVTWSTIIDFDGDTVNIWGWVDGTSQVLREETNGAEGYQGITLHMDLDGDNHIDTSITFTGLAANDIANRQAAAIDGNGYLLITA